METSEINTKIELLTKLKKEKEEIEDVLKAKNSEIAACNSELMTILKELNQDAYVSPFGRISIKTVWRVKVPQTEADKELLFNELKSKGRFYEYVTVNSNSINAYYNEEYKNAKDRGAGLDFSIPGIGPAAPYESVHLTKNKEKK